MRYLLLILIINLISGCTYNIPETEEETDQFEGEEFAQFFVLGSGYSAGMMDGVITSERQNYAFPAIIGEKINSYYEAEIFNQAEINSNLGLNYFTNERRGHFELFYRNPGDEFPARRALNGEFPGDWSGDSGLIRNFSFPGLQISEKTIPSGEVDNLYLDRIQIPDRMSVLDYIIDKNPAVVLVVTGYEDLLPFVLNGATGTANETALDSKNSEINATPVSKFTENIQVIVEQLQNQAEASIILATVPNPLRSPYFNTLRFNMEMGRELSTAEIGQLNNFYENFNSQVFDYNYSDTVSVEDRRPFIDFDVNGGAKLKARVIIDPSLPTVKLDDGSELPKIRQMAENEYLSFRAEQTLYDDAYGKTTPIRPEDVLTEADIEKVNEVLTGYNTAIRDLAASSAMIHLLDVERIISDVTEGRIEVGGVFYNSEFGRESIYSSDGLFLNPKGNALIARFLSEHLNQNFDVSLLPVNVNSYPGLQVAQDF